MQRPGRYVGGEWNSIRKDWASGVVKVAIAFPDTYEVGMSYLGLKILYGIINDRSDCLCERAFAPWADFEEVLRRNGCRLYSLESRRALKDFDIVGFSLAYELTYTNVLNMLDLGGIAVRSADRKDGDPIVIAGGPSCYNPEPMAEFIDAFLIGDGEEAINDIVDTYKGCAGKSRSDILKALSGIEGVYVPLFYEEGITRPIEKRTVIDLNGAYYPLKQIVPNIQVVHDRLTIEIMRGCKHACRFCQASAVYRPCRERSAEAITAIAQDAYAATGYDEISLLSLSSVDHSRIKDVIVSLNAALASRSVSISVPSLRIEENLGQLPALLAEVKKSGLTFAPEAGSEKMRARLGKNIDITSLFAALDECYKSGWNRVKLYFMIGLPGEDDDDLAAIVDLSKKVSEARRKHGAGPAHVTASINAFIPKPHTAMQAEPMARPEALDEKRRFLRRALGDSKAIKLDFHSFEMSCIEAAFSRGDRKSSGAVFAAWKSGARFDGWQEKFDMARWLGAFEASGLDPGAYAFNSIPDGARMAWDMISLRPGNQNHPL